MNKFFIEHIWITYAIIVILISYVYNKVFRVRKLPLIKDALIYLIIALGSFILLFFQLNGLPIILSLAVAVFLMFLVRVRYFVEERERRKKQGASRKEQG
ncbi:YlaH-like family protein [Paenibacillus thermotolerans]|uniref:YlaH-like family protein n=1 Tax=Paenibacillus thermotolerans TaxID=3027807 RepID=UPI002367CED2|nr:MULTISPECIES: YlaH-like family protein [unclassified Paenibacillus]